jgi:hypothetical protein
MCDRRALQAWDCVIDSTMPRCVAIDTSGNATLRGAACKCLVGGSGAIDSSGQKAVKSDKLASWGPDPASTHSVAAFIS